jgi:type I restriction enzyme, S subunit
MKMNQPLVELQDICRFISGGTPSTKVPEYFAGTIPWITGADMNGNVITEARQYITEEAIQHSATNIVSKGNILLVTRTGVGKVAIAGVDICISQDFTGLELDKTKVDEWYLFYFLLSQVNVLTSKQRGATIQGITRDVVENLRVPLPSLTEQKRVASLLARADHMRQLNQTAHDMVDSLFHSVFLEIFGDIKINSKHWERIETQDIFEIQLGKMLSAKEQTGKYLRPYLRNLNVQWGYIDFSDVKQMDFNDKEFKKFKLKDGDILVCEGGEVGRTAIYRGEIEDCCYQNALHRLRIKKPLINPYYFLYFMRAAAEAGLILEKTSQVTIAHFTAEKFKEFQLLLPPLSLQEEFAGVVARVESLRGRMGESTRQVEGLFDSLLNQSFSS